MEVSVCQGRSAERAHRPALNVEGRGVGWHVLSLVGEDRLLIVLCGTGVVVGGKLLQAWLKGGLADHRIEVEKVGG